VDRVLPEWTLLRGNGEDDASAMADEMTVAG
jgi:hypothetical protein